ncbi:MAG: hypothetical protein ACI8P9_005344 [Parasphingorhabdus sp.]|jgi:hypothetical protein
MLKTVAESPYLNLLSGIVLLISAGDDILESLHEI